MIHSVLLTFFSWIKPSPKLLVKGGIIGVLAFGGGYATRQNSTTIVGKEYQITSKSGVKTTIKEWINWGDPKYRLDPDTLVKIWKKKPRLCSEFLVNYYELKGDTANSYLAGEQAICLMVAKAYNESAFCPCYQRYEIGQHMNNPYWAKFTEFEATSGGLFQWMGFNFTSDILKKEAGELNRLPDSLKWGYLCDNIDLQVDLFDKFMSHCLLQGSGVNNGKDIIYKAIAAYGGHPSRIDGISDTNYNTYLQLMRFQKEKNYIGAIILGDKPT